MKDYFLIRLLGRGGTSEVYLGVDKRSGERCAIKKYKSESAFQNAGKELELLKKLEHPSIPGLRELVCEAGCRYAVMDYVPGITLKEKIQREKRVAESEIIRWGMELCDVLSYLHRRFPSVIYRDLKPANIMISSLDRLSLIDFGAAVELPVGGSRRGKNRETMLPMGTPGYAAPEQFAENAGVDERTDIYALGATLFHMLTGEKPICHSGDLRPGRMYHRKISGAMEAIVEKCLKKEMGERYRFCEEVKEDLKQIPRNAMRRHQGFYVSRSELSFR